MFDAEATHPFFRNVAWLTLGGAAAQVLGFLVIVFLAQRLGVERFGEISLAQAALVYLTLAADPGLKILGTRQIAKQGTLAGELIHGVWSLRLLLAVGVVLLWSLGVWISPMPAPRNWLMWGYGVSVLPLALAIEWVFSGRENLRPLAISRLLRSLVHLATVFWLVRAPDDLIWAPILFGVSHLSASAYLLYTAQRQRCLPAWGISVNGARRILFSALPLGISAAMIQIYYYLDSLLLGVFRTAQEIGYYSAGYKVILFFLAIADVFATALLPAFSRLAAADLEKLRALLPQMLRLLLFLGAGMMVSVLCLATDTLQFLFGEDYLPGAPAMMILSGVLFLVFGNLPFGTLLLALHLEKKYTIAVSSAALANLLLNLVLIPKFGIYGAAATTIVSESIVWVAYLLFLRGRGFTIAWAALLVPLALAAGILALTLSLLPGHVILRACGGMIVYVAVARLLQIWSPQRLRDLTHLLKFAPVDISLR